MISANCKFLYAESIIMGSVYLILYKLHAERDNLYQFLLASSFKERKIFRHYIT